MGNTYFFNAVEGQTKAAELVGYIFSVSLDSNTKEFFGSRSYFSTSLIKYFNR